jgi:hypothetical protein
MTEDKNAKTRRLLSRVVTMAKILDYDAALLVHPFKEVRSQGSIRAVEAAEGVKWLVGDVGFYMESVVAVEVKHTGNFPFGALFITVGELADD